MNILKKKRKKGKARAFFIEGHKREGLRQSSNFE